MSTNTSKTLELFSKKTVQEHNTANDCWVTYQNRKIYDVTRFLSEHPGGDESILDYAGKDITEIMKDSDVHEHSDSAYEILEDEYLIGYLATDEEAARLLTNKNHKVEVQLSADGTEFDSTTFVKELPAEEKLSIATDYSNDYKKHKFLDLNRPLLMQILRSDFKKDFYVDQIHRPRHYGKGSAPLFGNFLEPLTKTAWWVVPVAWLPVVVYHMGVALKNMNQLFACFLFCVGVFVWTLIEYGLHRFLFHFDDWLPESNIAFATHFLLHGCHHYLPMDKYRLVMPPTLFVILCAPFYKLVFALLPLYWAYAGFAGGLFGYVCYDECHFFLHHSKLPPFMRKLKKYHLEHHYKNYQLGFGVTSWFWDEAFGTYLGPDAPLSKMKYE
ncbi:CDA_G0043030.mRNA.1.CDS.1 [Saccharomyces cerevisiae]|nr:CDA_G0043030.mRNA.1.CDS.1 [Saccharomyces cerevisiae]CAI7433863.1 CDA_G0043030.mRNA.1.CDS.1 [Saccharomyces cerevisiae]